MPRIFDREFSDLVSLAAVPCLGEIPYVEGLEAKRAFLTDLFEGNIRLQLLESVLPRR